MAKKGAKAKESTSQRPRKEIIFLYGDDYLVRNELKRVNPGIGRRKLVDAISHKDDVVEATCSLGLGEEGIQVVLSPCPPSEAISKIIDKFPDGCSLIVIGFPRKGTKVEKEVRDRCTVCEKITPLERDKAQWVCGTMTGMGKVISFADAEQLCRSCNGDMSRIANEMEKLRHYVGTEPNVTATDIYEVVPSSEEFIVWNLSSAMARCVGQGVVSGVIESMEHIRRMSMQGDDNLPVSFMSTLSWYFTELALVRSMMDKGFSPENATLNLAKFFKKDDGSPKYQEYAIRKAYDAARIWNSISLITALAEINSAMLEVRLARDEARYGVLRRLVLAIAWNKEFSYGKTKPVTGREIRWSF
jgi:DNA polymerase III delta subunit